MCFVAIATLLTHDRGTFLKHSQFHTEPGVLVIRTGQRLLSLHDLNAVGHTGREAFTGPWLLISVKPSILLSFGTKVLRRIFLARSKRDLVAATEMPARSAISFTER